MIAIALLLCVLQAQDSPAKRRGDLVVKIYDASSLLREIPEPSNPTRWRSHVSAPDWRQPAEDESEGNNPFWPEREGGAVIRPEDLLGILRAAATPSAWAQGDASMDVQGNALLVEAPAGTHEEIARLLPALESLLRSQEILLRVDALTIPEGSFPAGGPVLDAAETQKLAARMGRDLTPAWSAHGKVFSGRAFAAARREQRSFLRSYEVEVATKSKGTRPVVGQALTGPAVSIRPFLLHEDRRILLSFLLEDASLRQMDSFETRSQDTGTVQIPRIGLSLFAGSATLSPGESLLVSSSGDLSSAFWVRAEPAAKANNEPGELRLVDPRFVFDGTGRALPRLDARLEPQALDPLGEDGSLPSPDFLPQIVSARDRSGWQRVSGGFFVHKGPKLASEPFRLLESSHAEPVILDLILTKGPQAATPVMEARLTALPGRLCGFWAGLEASHVAGYEIQIAQESTVAAPIVVPLFDGVQFRARVLSRNAVGAQLAVDLSTNAILSSETVHSGLPNAGDFVTTAQKSASCLREVDLPWNAPVSLGELGPISESTRGERLHATLRARKAGK